MRVTGQEYLKEYRLKPDSPDPAGHLPHCCNSGMFLDFTKVYWLTMYRNSFFRRVRRPLEMRVYDTRTDETASLRLLMTYRNYDGHSGKFMLRLIAAWIAMGLRRPMGGF